jgi:HlyD family secretion protein
MDPLEPIPTPFAQRWEGFRMRVIPLLVFALALAGVAVLWKDYAAAPTLVGEVEPIRATVASYKPGVLAQLNVSRFQRVRAGEAVARVVIAEPRVLAASLAVIQAEIGSLRAGMQPLMNQQRNVMDYDQLRLDWMRQRSQLAMTRVNLQLAENDYRRQAELFKEKIVSERVFDQAQAARDKLRAQLEELTKLVAEQEQNFKRLGIHPTVEPSQIATNALEAAIAVQEEKLRLAEAELSPLTLRVPVDGMVSAIYRRSGESITAGEPILAVSAPHADRIVGYLREPLTVEPKVGMPVQVRSRGLTRQSALSRVVEVGAQMEPIGPPLLPPLRTATPQWGLPIAVSLPAGTRLRPGELVDLTLLPDRQ